jgi:ribosomal protein S18 acetylase RimI-like enzyme
MPFIRPGTETDLEDLLHLMSELYREDGSVPFNQRKHRRAVEELLSNPDAGGVWILDDDGSLEGYVVLTIGFSLEYGGLDAFVDELFVSHHYRGCGFGRKLVALVEEECRHRGVRALHLEVERENTSALSLYRRLGFADHDRYLMTKWLDR